MTALIIIAAIVLVIIILLNVPVTLFISVTKNRATVTARYLLFRFNVVGDDAPKKKAAKKKPAAKSSARKKPEKAAEKSINKSSEASTENSADKGAEKSGQASAEKKPSASQTRKSTRARRKKEKKALKTKRSISETLDLISEILGLTGKHIRKLLFRITIDKVKLRLLVSDDDAFEAAMTYGAINAAVWNFIALLSTIFSVKIKSVNILCGFDEKKLEADGSCIVKLRPASALTAVAAIGLKLLYKYKLKKSPDGKKAARENRKENAA